MRATRKRIRSHLLLCFLFSSFAQSRTLYSHTYRKDNSIIRCEETLHNKRLGSATFVFSNRVFHQDVALFDHNVKTSIRSNRIEKYCILRCDEILWSRLLDYHFDSVGINNMHQPPNKCFCVRHTPESYVIIYALTSLVQQHVLQSSRRCYCCNDYCNKFSNISALYRDLINLITLDELRPFNWSIE